MSAAGYERRLQRNTVKYTGVIIENYEDDKAMERITEQIWMCSAWYFGNMILHQGGEPGYHGYNHQPLSLSNVDYGTVLPYKPGPVWLANGESR